jgi:uncharacterized membrane protein YeiB
MNGRRHRRYRIRILRGDVLVALLLVGAAVAACVRWAEKAVATIAIPIVLLIALVAWRSSRSSRR